VAVSNVFYQLNNNGWNPVTSFNGTNWSAAVTLTPGTNTVQAYAVDTSGNVSATNTVKFIYLAGGPAPGLLNGLVAAITPDGQSTFYVGFWTNTFSQGSTDTNNDFGVGTYTYTKLTTNTARLVTIYTSPPLIAGNGTSVFLTFTTNGECTYSNEVNSVDLGVISLTASPNLVPASLNGKEAVLVNNLGEHSSMVFGSGTLTVTNTDGTVNSDTYTLKQYSPIGTQVVAKNSSKTNYVEFLFNAADYGDYFNANYDSSGSLSDTGSGVFALVSQAAGGNAPAGLAGTNLLVTEQASSFLLSLGSTTFSQTSADTNNNNGIGGYTYARLGSNTAQLSISYTAPPTITNQGSSVFLTFIATNFGLFTNQDDNGSNYLASVSLSAATNLVPASLAGLTISLTNNNGTIDIVTFNSGNTNTFSQTESNSGNPGVSSGTYTFTPSSLVGAMAQLNFTGGVASGSVAYVQTTFTKTNTGLFYFTVFDLLGNLQDSGFGTFSMQ
jgi:hypothetical protein